MKSEVGKLCLKWNDFQENALIAFRTLREDREFSDVTLVCEDGQQVEAHKVVLASSSPFFLNLLRRNKHPHPLIFMRGVKSEELLAMVDFLYYGEANIYQGIIDSFLAVAEELQLKGLMGSGADKKVEEHKPEKKTLKQKVQAKPFSQREPIIPDTPENLVKNETGSNLEAAIAITESSMAETADLDLEDLDSRIKSLMETGDKQLNNGGSKCLSRICKICGKEGTMGSIKNHIEAHHITGVSHMCDICGQTSRSRPALAKHKTLNHKKHQL